MKLLLLLILLLAFPAYSATDGTMGSTSSGQVVVTFSIPDLVRISSVEDIALGDYSGVGDLIGSTSYCVFRNGSNNYTLTLTTDQGSFDAASGANKVPFVAKIDDDLDASDGEVVVYNTVSGSLIGSSNPTCNGADNSTLQVTFAESDLQTADTSTWQVTITVLVSPI